MRINDKGKWEYMGGINPRPVEFSGSISASPHADVVRATYTVPDAKVAFISGYTLGLMQFVAATSIAAKTIDVHWHRADGGDVIIVPFSIISNSLTDLFQISGDLNLPLNAGDLIEAHTSDLSTGGLGTYNMLVSIIEFDK